DPRMSAVAPQAPFGAPPSPKRGWRPARRGNGRGRRSSPLTWRLRDQLVLVSAWIAGLMLCVIAGAIVIYIGYRALQYLRPGLLFSRPQAATSQAGSGGFLDPLLGTMIVTVIGIALAYPLGIASAVWISEYGRPTWLARIVESSIEIVAGTPDI